MIELQAVRIEKPEDVQVLVGQSHFIKTVEDLHEALASSAPGIAFGVAFCESSGPRLVRKSGNASELAALAVKNALAIGAGHAFVVLIRGAFPMHVLRAVREVPELVALFCATGNPVQVIVAATPSGRGVLGVIDGEPPLGVEGDEEVTRRKALVRSLGLKL